MLHKHDKLKDRTKRFIEERNYGNHMQQKQGDGTLQCNKMTLSHTNVDPISLTKVYMCSDCIFFLPGNQ